jgi:hypothetical protein
MRTAPHVYASRAGAEGALWVMANDGRADCSEDRRYRALVLLATFASLRWGEVTVLRRCDLDLTAGCVRVQAAFSERRAPGSAVTLGSPKSKAARRVVGVPRAIVPDLRGASVGLRWSRAGWAGLHCSSWYPTAASQLQPGGRMAARRCGGKGCLTWAFGLERAKGIEPS